MPPILALLFIAVKMLFMSRKVACWVEYLVRNPNCSFAKIECEVMWSISLLYISFSMTFEKAVSKDIGL
jgi:hypothetical protein